MTKRAGYIILALVACAIAFWLGRQSVSEARVADSREVVAEKTSPQRLSAEDVAHARHAFRTRKSVSDGVIRIDDNNSPVKLDQVN